MRDSSPVEFSTWTWTLFSGAYFSVAECDYPLQEPIVRQQTKAGDPTTHQSAKMNRKRILGRRRNGCQSILIPAQAFVLQEVVSCLA